MPPPPHSLGASTPEREPVVIRASFWPFESTACDAPDIDPDKDGEGAWYVGAPCQQVRWNPTNPLCWQTDEDPCILYSNPGTLTVGGTCPNDPCKAEYVVDITILEPCVKPCDYPKCCASGWLNVTDLTSSLGIILTGQTRTFDSVADCPCTEVGDHSCKVMMQVQCQELGAYFYALATFGYHFTCRKCGP